MAEIEGLRALEKKLVKLGATLGGKALRQAAMLATTPAVREMKAAVPVGSKEHKTHRGRLVAPGFLSRSIKRKSRLKNGTATITIGVASEAFYGVHFVDRGTKNASAQPWFKSTFERNQKAMELRLASALKDKIKKIAAAR